MGLGGVVGDMVVLDNPIGLESKTIKLYTTHITYIEKSFTEKSGN